MTGQMRGTYASAARLAPQNGRVPFLLLVFPLLHRSTKVFLHAPLPAFASFLPTSRGSLTSSHRGDTVTVVTAHKSAVGPAILDHTGLPSSKQKEGQFGSVHYGKANVRLRTLSRRVPGDMNQVPII